MTIPAIVEKIIEAHGSAEYWNSLEAFEGEISAHGFLFTAKRVPVLDHVRIRALTREPRFTFFNFPKQGQTGEFIGDDEVRILDSGGKFLERRVRPRSAFRRPRRLFFWDNLDFLYFAGYATWNYLTTPFLFLREGFAFEEMQPVRDEAGILMRLRVTFPPDIPTHCREQIFYFDERLLLRRLDYTAEVVGRWAHAAHLCGEYREFGPLKVPSRRRVLPLMFGNKPLPGPVLVDIKVHDIRPIQP
jgi:hypothetical protein